MGRGESYEDVVTEIYELQKFSGRISLEPITELMERLDSPHDDVPVVHIAGTNGKGSTTLILASMLREAGYRVGTYTSPHLLDFRERVKVNGKPISQEQVTTYYNEIVAQDVDLSFFEFTTALAFLHFSREDVDVAVIETGLGGRLDATNIVDPELSIITNIGEDHTQWLGETPEQIAYEKAGIVKEGRPVVSGVEGSPATVIEQVADAKGAELVPVRERVTVQGRTDGNGLVLSYSDAVFDTDIVAAYQVDNINTAVTACTLLDGFNVTPEDMQRALALLDVEGRMEQVADYPLVLMDGAHNPAGMRRAAATIRQVRQGKTVAVVSIMGDKDYDAMMQEVESFADVILATEAEIDRAANPEELAGCVTDTDVEVVPDLRRALRTAIELTGEDDTIVFTGSLYFVGDVKWTLEDLWWSEDQCSGD